MKNQFSKLLLLAMAAGLVLAGCEAEDRAEADEFETKTLNTEYESIELSKVAGPFENPWSVAFLPDNRMLVTERPGRLNIVDEDGSITEVDGIPEVAARNQGGLMEVLPHYNYPDEDWIYLTFSKPNGEDETATALYRGRIDENNSFVDIEEVFTQNMYSSPGRHYGSRLAWMDDGTLLMSIGDRGTDPPRAQATDDHAGTLLRLNDDGSVPDDNPFLDNDDVLNEIYSYGHRNIQGLIVSPDGEIWSTEHGPRGGDELNYHQPAENYGWPTVTLGRNYGDEGVFPGSEARSMEGKIDPVYEFLPTHAPSGLALVTSDNFEYWEGNLLAGGLRSERIRRLVIEDNTVIHDEELLHGEIGRIRDVREGPDGNIYIVTDHEDGALYRVAPAEE